MKESQYFKKALAPLRGAIAWSFAFSLGINLLMLTVPLYLLQLFDRVLSSRSLDTLWVLTLISVVALLTYGLLESVRKLLLTRVGYLLDTGLGAEVFSELLRRPKDAGEYHSVQQLKDVATLRAYFSGNSLLPWLDGPWSIIFIAVIFALHPVLGWLSLAALLVLFGVALINESLTRDKLLQAANQINQGTDVADAAVANSDAVSAMGMSRALVKRWEVHHQDGLLNWEAGLKKMSSISSISKVMRLLLQIVILGTGAILVIEAELTAGGMIASSILVSRALAPVDQLIGTWGGTVAARNAYRSLKQFMAEANSMPASLPLPVPDGKVQVEGLSYVHPGKHEPILKSLSFSLNPGESLGLIGPTGSGKTTLARLLLGILTPRLGCVRLDGMNVANWSSDDRGQYLGYLPQDLELFSGTVAENIARFNETESEQVFAAARLAGAHEMIMALDQGYDTAVGEMGQGLSGGQKQRIALARALFGSVKFVVMDEPNANQDRVGETALLQSLKRLKEKKITTVVIAHRPGVIQTVDKLLVLKDGRIANFGTRDEVLASLGAAPRRVESS